MRLKIRFFRTALSVTAVVSGFFLLTTLASADENLSEESLPVPVQPVQLRLQKFEIPFAVDTIGTRPTEVELFVSRDAGAQWAKFASQPPTGKKFLFEATADGDYWFATRTVDGTGRSFPEGPISPQLYVRIDTTDPRIDLHTEFADDSTVKIDLRCIDAGVDASTLQIEYTTDINKTWVAVPNATETMEAVEKERLEGTIRFQPQGDWHLLSVRIILKDAAGNMGIATHQLQRPRLAGTPGQLASSPVQRLTTPVQPVNRANNSNPYAVRAMQILHPTLAGPLPESPLSSAIQAEQLATPPPVAVDEGLETNTTLLSAPELNRPTTAAPPRRPATPAEAMRPITSEQLATPPAQPLANEQSVARQAIDSDQTPPTPAPADSFAPLDGSTTSAPVRYSGSRKFSLDYEVESAGRAGVEEVELWGSSDRGQTWKRWGADPDRQTPFDIETNNDAVYGFCIVVVAKNGLATARPISQSTPDIYVVVDTVKPIVRITGANYGEADQTGSLLVRYECEDENLSTRPIALSFSNSPQGPWTTMAAGLENRGGYAWPADPQLPRQIFLRIDATDQSGNTGSYVLDKPIDVQGLAPRARIRGFNPITGTGSSSGSIPQTATVPQDALPTVKFK